MSGKFIVFEGINGSGKTTIINNLINYYNKHNIKYKYIKFPNRSSESGKIIDKFLKNEHEFLSINEQIKIFADNRKEEEEIIKNALNNNEIILCDRYLYSNIAYILTDVTHSLYLNKNKSYITIDNIIKYDKGSLKPDLVFLINGDYINLRNDNIQERYHNNEIKNVLIFNNYLIAFEHTKTEYIIINNILGHLKNTTDSIIKKINQISNNKQSREYDS